MSVVANAGPLIALARIGHLYLLESLYGGITLPTAVFEEVTSVPDLPGAAQMTDTQWLNVLPVGDHVAVQRLRFWLDLGESEAIILAHELGAYLLMDERRGRTIAAAMGLQITGTLGVLLAAKNMGQINVISPLLDALQGAGVRLSQPLVTEAKRLAGE